MGEKKGGSVREGNREMDIMPMNMVLELCTCERIINNIVSQRISMVKTK